jgi:hypothetical protein
MDEASLGHLKRYAAIFMPVAAVGGFVSDVIQPLAPLSTYVFWASMIGTVALIISVFIWRTARPRLLPLLILSASFMTFSSILLVLQTGESQAKGVLATNFPAIAKLQETIGLVQKDIAEIKETTRKTAEAVERVEESTKNTEVATRSIAESTDRIAASLEAIQQGFAGLNKAGGIIENAQKPEEHYHNARAYEQRGDYANARRSYNAFFAYKLSFIDPHLRYQTFLKIQEGRAGAREIYSAMYEQDPRPLLDFARILLLDPPERVAMLESFLEKNPDFVPGFYELSREYSAARKGTQSLGDKQAELAALERFKALHDEGKFVKYFIDQSVAAEWLEDADSRLKSLAVLKRLAKESPVTLSASRSNSGWTISLLFKEVPREIFYRLGDDPAFRSTGLMDITNNATGLKTPNMSFPLKPTIGNTRIFVKYTDIGNETRGPFELDFDPDQALVTGQKQMLDQSRNSWLAFRDYDGKVLLYFTHLISYRCALDEVTYGIDSDATPSTFALEPCNAKDPYNVGDGPIYIEVPTNSKFASVKLTFKDGTQSETVRIER